MDPLSLTAVSAAAAIALTSAATEAGKRSFDGLVELFRHIRWPGKSSMINQMTTNPETVDANAVAKVLHDEAVRNPEFAAQLQQWVREQTNFSGSVTFNNTGQVAGNVTQIGNVSGSVTFN